MEWQKSKILFAVMVSIVSLGAQISEKPMVIVIPSFNNQDWYQKNLDSVFSQKYSNYRVMYIDDCSPDGTADLVECYLEKHQLKNKCHLIKNKVRYGQLFNRYKAIYQCRDDEIIVLLDGDDWLAHDHVLSYLNTLYSEQDIWMTVGNAVKSKEGQKIGYRDHTDAEIEQLGFRQLGFRGVHPRTFYAGLFKKIKTEDLMCGGRFLTVATDVAFMLPMFEMARNHYAYIHDILYVYNNENSINLYKSKFDRQIYFDITIRNRKKYETLDQLFFEHQDTKHTTVTGLFFMQEESTVEPFIEQQTKMGVLFENLIMVQDGDPYLVKRSCQYPKTVLNLKMGYPLEKIYQFRFNFKNTLQKSLVGSTGQYLMFGNHELLKNAEIELNIVINQLEQTGARVAYFGNLNQSALTEYCYELSVDGARNPVYLGFIWSYHHLFEAIADCCAMILKKDDFMDLLQNLEIFHPNYYTLLPACNSVLKEHDMILLVQK